MKDRVPAHTSQVEGGDEAGLTRKRLVADVYEENVMRKLNPGIVFSGSLIVSLMLLMQACSTDVGGDQDAAASTVTITAITDDNDLDGEVIGEATIHWANDEPNRSTVDILLSSDSGAMYDTIIALNVPDTGEYVWDTNTVPDCRTCRLRIIATDIAGNLVDPADTVEPYPGDSVDDFIINNVPQVFGDAYYFDTDNKGYGTTLPGNPDRIIVSFDKDITLFASFPATFRLPVKGDSIGLDAVLSSGPNTNEITIEFEDNVNSHLHVLGEYAPAATFLTASSGIDIFEGLPDGIITAVDNGRTVTSSGGVDIKPTFSYSSTLPSELGIGTITNVLATGDLNNDGRPDVVTGYFGELVNWLQDSTGVFYAEQFLASPDVRSIAIADLDKDGDLDVVVGNYDSAGPKVLFNNGSGLLADSGQVLGSFDTSSVAIVDVDNDQDYDLIAGNMGQPNRVYKNNGAGVFTMTAQALGNAPTASIAAADVDNDGDMDFIEGSETVRIWLNDGIGNYSDSGQLLGDFFVESIAADDIDNDGDVDFVAGNAYEGPNRVWINNIENMSGQEGVFVDSGQAIIPDTAFNLNTTNVVVLHDYDKDGDPDLITGNGFEIMQLWPNDGNGVFSTRSLPISDETNTAQINTRSIVLADIDDDGDDDLIAGGNQTRIWRNSLRLPGYRVIQAQSLPERYNTYATRLGDVDNDGDNDIIAGNFEAPNQIYLNDGNAQFINSGQNLDFKATRDLALGDLDEDGDLDMVTGNYGQGNRVWWNDGAGMFTDSGQALGSSSTFAVALGDVDGDGDLDLVSGNNAQPNRVWRNDGSGNFKEDSPPQLLGASNTQSVALGDVDGDGDLDLVSGNYFQTSRVWRNDGAGVFTDTGQAVGNNETQSVALGDVDSDGDIDIVTGELYENLLWLNDGTGLFSDSGQLIGDPFAETRSISLGDADNDGDLDIVTGNGGGDPNQVWINRAGRGEFVDSGIRLDPGQGNNDTNSIQFGDIDNDGDMDIISGNHLAEIRVWASDE